MVPVTVADFMFVASSRLKRFAEMPPATDKIPLASGVKFIPDKENYSAFGSDFEKVIIEDYSAPETNYLPVCGGPCAQPKSCLESDQCISFSGRAMRSGGAFISVSVPGVWENPYAQGLFGALSAAASLVASGANPEEMSVMLSGVCYGLEKPENAGKLAAMSLGVTEAQRLSNLASLTACVGGKNEGDWADSILTVMGFAPIAEDGPANTFMLPGSNVVVFTIPTDDQGLPVAQTKIFETVASYVEQGKIYSARALGPGGIYTALGTMCKGSVEGFVMDKGVDAWEFGRPYYGGIIAETSEPLAGGTLIGHTISDHLIDFGPAGKTTEF